MLGKLQAKGAPEATTVGERMTTTVLQPLGEGGFLKKTRKLRNSASAKGLRLTRKASLLGAKGSVVWRQLPEARRV